MRLTEADLIAIEARLAKNRGGRPQTSEFQAADDEGNLQEDIIAYCRSRGWWVDFSRMDKKTTRPAGAPDLLVWADGGRMFACECKRKGGKLRPEQLGVKLMLEKLGHRYMLITSLQQFIVETNR